MWRRVLSMILVATLTASGSTWAAPGSSAPVGCDSGAALGSMLHDLAIEARRLRPMLDRSQFDLEMLIEAVDYDAEQIERFVTEEVALEVYAGVLRGARGTLTSRAGNSLDQALLLATLLRDAGYEAVIRRGRLSEDQAAEVVEAMGQPRRPSPSIWLDETGGGTAAGSDASSVRAAWVAAARAKSDLLVRALGEADIVLDASPVLAELREEARDYFWVDHREGPSDGWRSAHPAIGRDPGVEPIGTISGAVPPELAHRVTLDLRVVQRLGSKTEEASLFAPLEMVSAGLVGRVLNVSLSPDQLANPDSPLDPEAILANSRFLIPMIGESPPAGAKAISLRGFTVPLDSLGMGAGGIFETVSEKGSQAIDAISGLGGDASDPEPAVAIEALQLHATFRSPSGRETTAIRDLFHSRRDLTPEARQGPPGGDLVAALARTHSFVFATGAYHEGLVVDSLLAQMESLEALFATADSIDPSECRTISCLGELEWESAEADANLGMLYLAFDSVFRGGGSIRAYRHMPNLVSISRPLLPPPGEGVPESRMDIVSNARRVLSVNDTRVEAVAAEHLLAGVWETQIETDMLGGGGVSAPRPSESIGDLRRYTAEDVAPHQGGGSVATAMQRDLDGGFLIFADASLDLRSSSPDTRWWRVDPRSGETLGMNVYGGAQLLEIVAVLLIAAVFWATTVAICMAMTERGPAVCFVCFSPPALGLGAGLFAITFLTSNTQDGLGHASDILRRFQNACARPFS